MMMNQLPLPVTACIINFEGRDVLEATLNAVLAQRPPVARVMLIDNASTDGSVEFVRSHFPDVDIIMLPRNLGPGPARDAGFQAATTRYICMIDNDVSPEADCIFNLARAVASKTDAVLAMPRVVYAHDPALIQYDGASAHFLGLMSIENEEVPSDVASDLTRQIGSIIGACFLVDRQRWGDHELHGGDFFMYNEDHDLGLRARQLGLTILSVPTATCRHGLGTPGLSIRSTGYFTPGRITCTIANRWRVILMRYQLRTILLVAPTMVLFEIMLLAGSMKKGWMNHWLDAVRIIWRDRDRIISERRAWRTRRRVGDGTVLDGGTPPFNAKLLRTRAERLGGSILDTFGRMNWKLVYPILSHQAEGISHRAKRQPRRLL